MVPDVFTFHPIGVKSVPSLARFPYYLTGSIPRFGEITRDLEMCCTSILISLVLVIYFNSCLLLPSCLRLQTFNGISNGMLYVQCSTAIQSLSSLPRTRKGLQRLRSTAFNLQLRSRRLFSKRFLIHPVQLGPEPLCCLWALELEPVHSLVLILCVIVKG